MLEPFLEVCEHKITESRAIDRRKRLLWMWKIGARKLFLQLKFTVLHKQKLKRRHFQVIGHPAEFGKKHIPYVSSLITESKSKLLPFSTRLQTLNHEALLCMCMLVRLCVHLVCAYVLAGMFMSFVCFVVVCWHTNAYTCIRRGPIISSVERLIGRLFSSHAYILIQESNRWLDRALWPI